MDNTTVKMPANRGFTVYKSTAVDTSDFPVKGTEPSNQLKNTGFGGGRDNLSHSITSGSVPAGK